MNSRPTQLARIAAVACSLAIGGNAMAGLVTVRYSDYFEDDLIVNHNDILIAGFTPILTSASDDSTLHNSIRFSFRPSGANVLSLISGNDLPPFPTEPFQTIALCADGGLDQFGKTIGPNRDWATPFFDLDTGIVSPATLIGFNSSGQINISVIPNMGFGYVGYAKSDYSMFGFMQIQRLSLYEWRLIGYAYDDSGAPITVHNVPSGGSLGLLGIAIAQAARNRRLPK